MTYKEEIAEELRNFIKESGLTWDHEWDGATSTPESPCVMREDLLELAEHFAKWQEERMIATTLKGEIVGNLWGKYGLFAQAPLPVYQKEYEFGDKIKIIVLKDTKNG